MKKIFVTIIICGLFVTALAGCKQENTANLIAKDLDTNLNKLEIAVNKLDSVDNRYLANPDIYSSLSATPTTNNKYFALAFNENTVTTSTDFVKQTLIDKITDKLIQNNSNYNKQDELTCKKYCDNNGDCYYTDCNGNNYCYTQDGTCYSCDTIPVTCSYSGDTTLKSEDDNFVVTQLSIQEETQSANNDSQLSEDTNNINTPNPKVKVFYFSQDSFAPIKLKYNPRYISQYNETTINEQIESYLTKVQKLYAMSEDSIEANTTLNNCKQNIIECVQEIKDLNDCILNGNCEPSNEQLQALNNYIIDIKTTTKRIKDCSGELTKEVNNINKSESGSMINSVDVMSSNYMRLINHIDTRVTYHKSAIATLQQIKYLLDNAVNNNEISDEEIEQLIENFTIIEDSENNTTSNNNEITDTENVKNDNENKDAVIDNNNNDSVSTYNSYDTYNDVLDNNDNIYDNNTIENNQENTITSDSLETSNETINTQETTETTEVNNAEISTSTNSENIQSENNINNEEINTDSSISNNINNESIDIETTYNNQQSEAIIDDEVISEDVDNIVELENESYQKKN